MSEQVPNKRSKFGEKISERQRQLLKAQTRQKQSVWRGIGLFGIVGWSIVMPLLGGTALGIWLDHKWPQSFSWTLSLLILGLVVGCIIAWHWLTKEQKEINQEEEESE